ncbi:MAG: hypothetical protein QM752_05045 [Gammaproteobacteria bacterium]
MSSPIQGGNRINNPRKPLDVTEEASRQLGAMADVAEKALAAKKTSMTLFADDATTKTVNAISDLNNKVKGIANKVSEAFHQHHVSEHESYSPSRPR